MSILKKTICKFIFQQKIKSLTVNLFSKNFSTIQLWYRYTPLIMRPTKKFQNLKTSIYIYLFSLREDVWFSWATKAFKVEALCWKRHKKKRSNKMQLDEEKFFNILLRFTTSIMQMKSQQWRSWKSFFLMNPLWKI
jgi:hypothetical protein